MGRAEDFPHRDLGRYARLPLAHPPGTTWAYGMSLDVLGAIIEVVSGSTLRDAVRDEVTGPLAMLDTGLTVQTLNDWLFST